LLHLEVMPTQRNIFDENPSVEGPDYVALVIEWDELADELERKLRADQDSLLEPLPQKRRWPVVGIAAGGLAVLALATYGLIHRLRS